MDRPKHRLLIAQEVERGEVPDEAHGVREVRLGQFAGDALREKVGVIYRDLATFNRILLAPIKAVA